MQDVIFVLKESLTTTWGRDYKGRKGRQGDIGRDYRTGPVRGDSDLEQRRVAGKVRELAGGGDV